MIGEQILRRAVLAQEPELVPPKLWCLFWEYRWRGLNLDPALAYAILLREVSNGWKYQQG